MNGSVQEMGEMERKAGDRGVNRKVKKQEGETQRECGELMERNDGGRVQSGVDHELLRMGVH